MMCRPSFAGIDQTAEEELCQVLAVHGAGHSGTLCQLRNGPWSRTQLPQQVKAGGFGEHPQCFRGRRQMIRSGSDRMEQGRRFTTCAQRFPRVWRMQWPAWVIATPRTGMLLHCRLWPDS